MRFLAVVDLPFFIFFPRREAPPLSMLRVPILVDFDVQRPFRSLVMAYDVVVFWLPPFSMGSVILNWAVFFSFLPMPQE